MTCDYNLSEHFCIELIEEEINNKNYYDLINKLKYFKIYENENCKGLLILKNYSKLIYSGRLYLFEKYYIKNNYDKIEPIIYNSYIYKEIYNIRDILKNINNDNNDNDNDDNYNNIIKINEIEDEYNNIINNYKVKRFGIYKIGEILY